MRGTCIVCRTPRQVTASGVRKHRSPVAAGSCPGSNESPQEGLAAEAYAAYRSGLLPDGVTGTEWDDPVASFFALPDTVQRAWMTVARDLWFALVR